MKNTIIKLSLTVFIMLAAFFGAAKTADAYFMLSAGFGTGFGNMGYVDPYLGYGNPVGNINYNNQFNNNQFISPYQNPYQQFPAQNFGNQFGFSNQFGYVPQPINCFNSGYPCGGNIYQPPYNSCMYTCTSNNMSSYWRGGGYYNDYAPMQTFGSNMSSQIYGNFNNSYGYYQGY